MCQNSTVCYEARMEVVIHSKWWFQELLSDVTKILANSYPETWLMSLNITAGSFLC